MGPMGFVKWVGTLAFGVNPFETDFFSFRNELTNQMISHSDVFCSSMINRVSRQFHSCLVVDAQEHWCCSLIIPQLF